MLFCKTDVYAFRSSKNKRIGLSVCDPICYFKKEFGGRIRGGKWPLSRSSGKMGALKCCSEYWYKMATYASQAILENELAPLRAAFQDLNHTSPHLLKRSRTPHNCAGGELWLMITQRTPEFVVKWNVKVRLGDNYSSSYIAVPRGWVYRSFTCTFDGTACIFLTP